VRVPLGASSTTANLRTHGKGESALCARRRGVDGIADVVRSVASTAKHRGCTLHGSIRTKGVRPRGASPRSCALRATPGVRICSSFSTPCCLPGSPGATATPTERGGKSVAIRRLDTYVAHWRLLDLSPYGDIVPRSPFGDELQFRAAHEAFHVSARNAFRLLQHAGEDLPRRAPARHRRTCRTLS